MNKLLTATVASLALLAAACGGDSGGGADRDELIDQLVESAADSGVEIDADCARDLADDLPDDDVEKILDAGPDGDPELSDEAEAITLELFECVEDFGDVTIPEDLGDITIPEDLGDVTIPEIPEIPEGMEVTDAMVDVMVQSMEASGLTVDRDCVADALEGMDLDELASGSPSPELLQSVMGCMTP